MILDYAHPLPRYGLAVALVGGELNLKDAPTDPEALGKIASKAIGTALGESFLYTRDNPFSEATSALRFEYFRDFQKLDPGRKSGQSSEKGYYLAPHVISSDMSAAKTIKAIRSLKSELDLGGIEGKTTTFKRSFAPFTAKLNNGGPSLTEPKTSLLEAAFTALGTLTRLKPASYVITDKGNYYQSIIPDLPLFDLESDDEPLIDFVRLFRSMIHGSLGSELYQAAVNSEKRVYKRPRIHWGNYPSAPRDASLCAIGLVGAIGDWAREEGVVLAERHSWAKRVLHHLCHNPLYVVSYDKNVYQVQFGHHAVGLALNHNVPQLLQALNKTDLYSSTAKTLSKKNKDPSWNLFRMMAGRFLQFFTPTSFRDFLSFRAQYHTTFKPIFEEYFMNQANISPEIVKSAHAYGAWLNYVCYIAASEAKGQDKANRTLNEYKSRALVQLESLVHSARSHTALISQLNITAGRLAGHGNKSQKAHEVAIEASDFLEAVAASQIGLREAKELITAFMRVSTYREKKEKDIKTITVEEAGDSDSALFHGDNNE